MLLRKKTSWLLWLRRLHSQLKELSEGGVSPGVSPQMNAENDEQIRILKVSQYAGNDVRSWNFCLMECDLGQKKRGPF